MKKRLKIMHLIGSVSVGGAQRLVLDLSANTNPADFEVFICTFGPTKKKTFLPEFAALNLPFFQIPSIRFYDYRNLRDTIKYIKENKIEIIHTHLTDGDIIGRIAGFFSRIPVVTTIHNEPKRFITLRNDKRILNYLTARFLSTHLVAVSGYLRQRFIDEWKIREEIISTIYNAVDVSIFLNAPVERKHGQGAPKFYITNVGRLSKQKAQHILLEAAQKVVAQFPDAQFQFVGQGKLEQDLKNLTHEFGINGNVTFMGIRRDVAGILAQSDIFVLSSLWEGLPLSAIEAMASACAIVLTDVGGNRELIENMKSGVIVPPGDSDALANALIELLEQDKTRLLLGREARTRVVEKFSLTLMVNEYEELYKKIWKETRKRKQAG